MELKIFSPLILHEKRYMKTALITGISGQEWKLLG